MKPARSEQKYAAVVVEWLDAIGADVYQEVECSGGVADIVAKVRGEIWIIEVKTSLSLALLLQSLQRRRDAHRVFIAAPYLRKAWDVDELLREIGVGRLEIRLAEPEYRIEAAVVERVHSRRWNSRPVALAKRLRPEHKTAAKAGSVGGAGRWTPFRDTCKQVAAVVTASPGILLKDAIGSIRHHYSSNAVARRWIAETIKRGAIAGVELRRENGALFLFPAEART